MFFLLFLRIRANNTAFNQLMKNIDLIPVFGTSFAVYIPLIMLIVALLTLFDGYGRLVKMMGIEWEEATADGHNGLSCSCRNRDQEVELDPQLQERIRTGKLIVSNELKQRRAAEELAAGVRTCCGSNSFGKSSDMGGARPNMMRIGVQDVQSLPRITEAFMPNSLHSHSHSSTRYRNVESATPDTDVDLDLDLSDHRSPYARPGPSARATLELSNANDLSSQSNADKMKSALFGGFGGNTSKSGGYSDVPQQPSTINPMSGATSERRASSDIFSVDNSGQNNVYGRYSVV